MNKFVKYLGLSTGVVSASLLSAATPQAPVAKTAVKTPAKAETNVQNIIHTVDVPKVFENWNEAKEVRKSLEIAVHEAHVQVDKMMEEGKVIIEKMQLFESKLQDPALSDAEKTKSKSEFESLQTQLHEKEREINRTRLENDHKLSDLSQQKMMELEGKLRDKISQYARLHKLSTVLNSIVVLYSEYGKDITEDIIKFVNQPVGTIQKVETAPAKVAPVKPAEPVKK